MLNGRDEPKIFRYENPSNCPKGVDVRQPKDNQAGNKQSSVPLKKRHNPHILSEKFQILARDPSQRNQFRKQYIAGIGFVRLS